MRFIHLVTIFLHIVGKIPPGSNLIGMQFGLVRVNESYDTLLDIWTINNADLLSVLHQLHTGITRKKAFCTI